MSISFLLILKGQVQSKGQIKEKESLCIDKNSQLRMYTLKTKIKKKGCPEVLTKKRKALVKI